VLEKVVENLEQHFEVNQIGTVTPNTTDPINIVCFDGGGAKGIAHLAMLQELSKKAGRNVLPSFHLTGGSSIGGITSLLCNACDGDLDEVCRVGYKTANEVRVKTFKKFSLWNLLKTGHLQNDKGNMAEIFHEAVGNAPLYNPNAMKSFALCTLRPQNNDTDGTEDGEDNFQPFVLRTYDMYKDALNNLTEEERHSLMDMPGTNEVDLWEAFTATSAAPILSNRIQMTVDGQASRFADGAVISNSAVAIAINEAKTIWPHRQLGVILSISLGGNREDETELMQRSVAAAQKSNPDLHFLRLHPPSMDKYTSTETNEKVLEQMKDEARSYVRESLEIDQLLDALKKQKSKNYTRRSKRISTITVPWRRFMHRKRYSVEEVNLKIGKIAARQSVGEGEKTSSESSRFSILRKP